MSLCLGPEFAVGPLGQVEIANARPMLWPYVCPPNQTNGLCSDQDYGLWVAPRQPVMSTGTYLQATTVSLPLSQYTNGLSSPGGSLQIINPSTCFWLQTMTSFEITCEFTMAANCLMKISPWIGQASTVPDGSTLPVYKTVHRLFPSPTSGPQGGNCSFTANLMYRIALAPGARVPMNAACAFYPAPNPGSTVAVPSLVHASIIMTSTGWPLMDPAAAVSDV